MLSKLMILLMFGFISACNGGGSASGIGAEVTPEPDEGPACSTSVVDSGSKASAAAQRRGQFSDVRLNPVNDREAFAYFDFAALSMKFTYWNGTRYVHELIAGYGTEANKVSMVFLSGGIPVVAWTTGGTDLMLAIRSSNTETAGAKWNSRVFAGVATSARAVKLEVTPNDMVGGVYNTIATAGRMKFLLCTSNCSSVSSYSNMSGAADFVGNDSNNTATNMVSVGFAWCKAAEDTYYPAAVFGRVVGAVNTTRYAMCPNATTSSCLTGAAWTVNSQLLPVAPTANVSSALHLDPTVTNDPAKILTLKTGVGVKGYLSGTGALNVGCKDITTGTTWDESTETLGAASTGNGWIELARTTNGKLHAVMNEGITNIRYYNTDIGTLSSWDTFWNIGNGYLNTVATSGAGGAVLDKENNIIYSSYYANSAVNRFNMMANVISALPTDSVNVVSTNSSINNDGHIALVTNVTRNVFMASTSSGEAGIAYVDYSAGANTTGVLKYAFRNGRDIDSSWLVNVVPGVTSPESPYLAYDHLDRPWISFFDRTNFRFFLMVNSSRDGSGVWTSYQMSPVGTPTAPVFPATNDTAIGMVSVAGTLKPLLVVLDNTALSRNVRAAYLDSTTGTWSSVVTVAAIGATGASGLNAVGDDSGNVAIAWLDRTAGNFLKYSNGQIVSGTPTFTTAVDIGTTALGGQGTSIQINPVTGSPVVAYLDRANNRLYRATCDNDPQTCAASSWSVSIIDIFTGLSGLSIATTFTENFASSKIVMGTDGSYDVFYSNGMTAQGDLKRISVDDQGNAGTAVSWVEGRGANLAATLNFGVQSFHSDAVLTTDNQIVSAYLGEGNLLVQKTCDLDILE